MAGVLLGAATNLIDGSVSADYFAIVMSWDWADAPKRAVLQGMLDGWALGLFFGVFFAIASAASTRLRCPPRLSLRVLAEAIGIVLTCWLIGGIVGTTLARLWPNLWGFFFVGVPPRVNLPRFAWVGGTIWGAYAGTVLALIVGSARLHLRWKRMQGPRAHGFGVISADSRASPVQ
jgi:hypothetical protein